ncbi:MAG: hypothetical protein GXP26_11330 [Planctomycetes bacterium]|nr:hypothetical protein [Planctomycetota bacterium]
MPRHAQAEEPPPSAKEANLAGQESRLADRFDRLELLAGRLAELSKSTQPRRARLLRELVTKSREQDIAGRFEVIVTALEQDRLASASERQGALQADLQKLLELLLQEGRDREIESERKRIGKYLAELKKLIRLQRGIKARTDGGDDAETLTKDQQQVAKATQELGGQIKETDGSEKPKADQAAEGENSDSKAQPSAGEPKEQTPGEQKSQAPKESDSEPAEGSKGKPKEGQPSPPSGKSQPSSGESPESDENNESKQQSPADRATQRLKQAQQRMQQAKKRLEEANRKDAVKEQEQALRELEQAKAELERILRQLREEEMERTLVLLEARLRKMLDAQIEIYEQTKKLDAAKENTQTHELEIASGRLSRKEQKILRDADRAMVLLREDGTSVAFPEALGQAIDDMQAVAKRLADVKLGIITQGLEEDIIATMEEILASLQQAIKELREQKSQQQQGEGQPGEQSLVDQLSELRMIRALQMRVNRRTTKYDEMIDGEQALEAELLEALDKLAIRQERIFEATRDLDTNRNQ